MATKTRSGTILSEMICRKAMAASLHGSREEEPAEENHKGKGKDGK